VGEKHIERPASADRTDHDAHAPAASATTLAAVGALSLLLSALVGCGGSSTHAPPVPQRVDRRGHQHVVVEARDDFFTPASIIVDQGTTVTFTNAGAVAHNVHKTADALDFGAPFGVDTADFGPGHSYSFTFEKPGTFSYLCTIHSLMSGTVQVEPLTSPSRPATVT
jgi:plastocyanin